MRRTNEPNIGLLASIAAATLALSGCGPHAMPRRCVDGNSTVVADSACDDLDRRGPVATGGYYPYRWYYGGSSGYVAPGTTVTGGSFEAPAGVTSFAHPTSGGTVRGVFGGSGGGAGE